MGSSSTLRSLLLLLLLAAAYVAALPVATQCVGCAQHIDVQVALQRRQDSDGISSTVGRRSHSPTPTPTISLSLGPVLGGPTTTPLAPTPSDAPAQANDFLSNRPVAAVVFTIVGLIGAGGIVALAFILFRVMGSHSHTAPSAEFATPESQAAYRGWGSTRFGKRLSQWSSTARRWSQLGGPPDQPAPVATVPPVPPMAQVVQPASPQGIRPLPRIPG